LVKDTEDAQPDMAIIRRFFRAVTRPLRRPLLPWGRASGFFRRGNEARDAGRWGEAVQFYERGLDLRPDAFPIWVQLGHALKESGNLGGAEGAYLRALQLARHDQDLHVQLGHLYSLQGDVTQAREYYVRAVGLGSHDRHALHFIACQERFDRPLRELLANLLPDETKRQSALNSTEPYSNLTQLILRYTQ
jgi:tetratricopeptide (TPR) repeat protein